MIDDHRHRILHAAAHIYALHGWRGATTRRIAEEAGVNEVTIFRQFGSKEALLELAMRENSRIELSVLPRVPVHPTHELTQWVRAHHGSLCARRDIIRQLMSDASERPDAAECVRHGPSDAVAQVREYVVDLRRHGWISETHDITPVDVSAAVTMLIGATFSDAMNRDMMPAMFPQPKDETLQAYVRIFLRGLGTRAEPIAPAARKMRAASSTSSTIE